MSNVLIFRKFSRPRQACVDLWQVYDQARARMEAWERRNRKRSEPMREVCKLAFDAFEDACTRELEELNK